MLTFDSRLIIQPHSDSVFLKRHFQISVTIYIDDLWIYSSTMFHVGLAPVGNFKLRPLIWPDIDKSHSVLSSLVLAVPGGSTSHYILLIQVNLKRTKMSFDELECT